MLVAYDYQIFATQKYGGISRYFYELATRIHTNDMQSRIIAPFHKNSFLKKAPKSITRGANIDDFPIPKLIKSLLSRGVNKYASQAWFNYKTPSIVHETYYSIVRLAPKKSKVVLTVYDMIHELFLNYFSENDSTSLFKKIAVERADHIICISHKTREDLINLFNVSPEKTSVVYLGISMPHQESHPKHIDNPYILYVGNRRLYKNFINLVKAYSLTQELQEFKIVCFGGGSLTDIEQRFYQSFGLSPNQLIHMQGDDNLLASLYAHASVFVSPSLYEGFGLPPLEAMSLGCPVACSNTGSYPEVAGNDAAHYFDPYQPENIAEALKDIIYSNNLKQQLIKNGFQRAQSYSWEKCSQETLAIYLGLT